MLVQGVSARVKQSAIGTKFCAARLIDNAHLSNGIKKQEKGAVGVSLITHVDAKK
jgi:hypothetical protein